MIHHDAFQNGGYTGKKKQLDNARLAHASMGYNFQIAHVAVSTGSRSSTVAIDVAVKQVGLAPFHYPHVLKIRSGGEKMLSMKWGMETVLVEHCDSHTFTLDDISASSLNNCVEFYLESELLHLGRPIRFAQGKNGSVSLRLPLPPKSNTKMDSSSFQSRKHSKL
jgi:hypothetical protein